MSVSALVLFVSTSFRYATKHLVNIQSHDSSELIISLNRTLLPPHCSHTSVLCGLCRGVSAFSLRIMVCRENAESISNRMKMKYNAHGLFNIAEVFGLSDIELLDYLARSGYTSELTCGGYMVRM